MEDYIALLLLVVPGFIARKVYKQTNDVHETTDQFTETLYCLLNSMAIFIIIFARIGILSFTDVWAKNLFDLKVLSETFETMSFVLEYSLAALIVSIILGLITGWLLDIYTKFINIIRRKKDMSDIAISHMVFDDIFNSPEYEFIDPYGNRIKHLVAIYKEDKLIARGNLEKSAGLGHEIYLTDCEAAFKKIEETFGGFPRFRGTYINGQTGILIKEYDVSVLFPYYMPKETDQDQ